MRHALRLTPEKPQQRITLFTPTHPAAAALHFQNIHVESCTHITSQEPCCHCESGGIAQEHFSRQRCDRPYHQWDTSAAVLPDVCKLALRLAGLASFDLSASGTFRTTPAPAPPTSGVGYSKQRQCDPALIVIAGSSTGRCPRQETIRQGNGLGSAFCIPQSTHPYPLMTVAQQRTADPVAPFERQPDRRKAVFYQ